MSEDNFRGDEETWSLVPGGVLTRRQTGRLTISRNFNLNNVYMNDISKMLCVHLVPLADKTCLYVTGRKEGYVLNKLQRELNRMTAFYERWDIKINEDNIRVIYFSHRIKPPYSLLMLNRQNTPFVNSVKYLGVLFDRKLHGGFT
jgi:hypothetical protein